MPRVQAEEQTIPEFQTAVEVHPELLRLFTDWFKLMDYDMRGCPSKSAGRRSSSNMEHLQCWSDVLEDAVNFIDHFPTVIAAFQLPVGEKINPQQLAENLWFKL